MGVLEELTQAAVNSAGADIYLLGIRVEVAAVLASLVIGLLQIGLIVGGLYQMSQVSRQRDRQLEQQAVDSERRHRESMRALADEREQSREESCAMMRALGTLIERTAPPPREAAG